MSQDRHKQSTETYLNPMYPGKRHRVSKRALFWAAFIPILLLNSLLTDWAFLSPKAFAALPVSYSAQGSNTFQQFLKNSQTNITSRGPSISQWPLLNSQSSLRKGNSQGIPQKSLPSAEPPTMQPISLVLDSTLTTPTMVKAAGIQPADLKGNDGRLEVQIPAGSLDVSQAVNANGAAANGTLTLKISHIQGNSIGALNMLGAYQIQIVDSQGQVINGVKLHAPITFTYHYRPAEIKALQLNPDHLFMSWPGLLTTARARHQSTANLAIPLTNNSQAHTLTAQSLVLTSGSVTVGVGYQNDQSPPKPNFVWEQGNTGNVGYTYPIQIAPGPGGFAPDLALTYSTAVPNNQHGWGQPSGDVGEGWNIGLGSVTSSMINGTTYYSISGIAGVSDLLLPIPG